MCSKSQLQVKHTDFRENDFYRIYCERNGIFPTSIKIRGSVGHSHSQAENFLNKPSENVCSSLYTGISHRGRRSRCKRKLPKEQNGIIKKYIYQHKIQADSLKLECGCKGGASDEFHACAIWVNAGGSWFLSSGTIIGVRWVVTAQHSLIQ